MMAWWVWLAIWVGANALLTPFWVLQFSTRNPKVWYDASTASRTVTVLLLLCGFAVLLTVFTVVGVAFFIPYLILKAAFAPNPEKALSVLEAHECAANEPQTPLGRMLSDLSRPPSERRWYKVDDTKEEGSGANR